MGEYPALTSDDKLYAGLGYAGLPVFFVPTLIIYMMKRDESDYIRFQLLQALGFGVLNVLIFMAFSMLLSIPVISFLALVPYILVFFGLFIYWILLMIWAFMGKDAKIPGLAQFIEQKFMQN